MLNAASGRNSWFKNRSLLKMTEYRLPLLYLCITSGLLEKKTCMKSYNAVCKSSAQSQHGGALHGHSQRHCSCRRNTRSKCSCPHWFDDDVLIIGTRVRVQHTRKHCAHKKRLHVKDGSWPPPQRVSHHSVAVQTAVRWVSFRCCYCCSPLSGRRSVAFR